MSTRYSSILTEPNISRYILQFFEWEGTSSKKYHFYKNRGSLSPICREHAQIGRPHTRVNNKVFKKSNMMSCQ